MHRWSARFISASLASTLATMPIAPSYASASAPSAERSPAAVLGIDSDDLTLGARLTGALRKAFAKRGFSGGEEAELSELRLALDCAVDEPVCLAQGGEMLGTRRLIYGQLRRGSGIRWTLTLSILEVDPVVLAENQTFTFERDRLNPSRVEELAAEIVGKMVGEDEPTVPESTDDGLPVADERETTRDTARTDDEPDKERRVWFGLERPTPRWKLALFGASAGLMVVSGGLTIGTGVWLTAENIGFRKQLLEAAEASLTDDNPFNDVDPNLPMAVNLCEYANQRPTEPDTGEPLGEEGQVRNALLVKECEDGKSVRTFMLGTGIGAAVFGATMLVSLGLLLIHRGPRSEPKREAWRRHRLRFNVAGIPGRGAGFSVRGRF